MDVERKENTYIGAKSEDAKKGRPKDAFKKADKACKPDAKPKSLSAKKRNILAIRKPNAVKSRSATAKPKAGKSEGGAATTAPKFSRFRRAKPPSSADELASIRDELAGVHEPGGSAAKRRPFLPPPAAPRLKKIRLKTSS